MNDLLENLEIDVARKRAEVAVSIKTQNTEALITQLRELRELYKSYFKAARKKRENKTVQKKRYVPKTAA